MNDKVVEVFQFFVVVARRANISLASFTGVLRGVLLLGSC